MSLITTSFNDRWLIALAVLLAAVVFVFPLTVYFPLLDPDEGLHASIAQEMVERGDWLAPRFLGEPFFDKPILYFWCQALSLRLFGMNEAALRLPGLIFGLLGAVTTGMIGQRMFGRTAGWVAGIFYGTMILPVALVQAASHDVALIPCINLAILFLWESDRARSKSILAGHVAAAGILLGLTMLTKGLIGVALVAVTYGSYLLVARRLSIGVCLRGLAVFILAAVVASPWFITVQIKYPGFLYYYFIERHILGFATATQLHGEAPWWYYLPIILGGGLPWIGYLPVAISDALARRAQKDDATEKAEPSSSGAMLLLFCWLIGCTVLLSAAHSKLATYIWPVFPAVAVLAAVGWARLLEGALTENARRSLLRTFFFSSLSGPIVLPLVVFVVHKVFAVAFSWPVWITACLAGLAALIPLIYLKKHKWQAMLAASALSTAIQFIAALTLLLPPVAEKFTARGLAEYFNHVGQIPARLLVAEERLGSLVFYLNTELRSGLKPYQIGMIFYDQPTEVPPGTIIVLPEKRGDQAYRYAELADLPYKTVGRYRVYEISSGKQ
jgi:4-amino-4-deoxy-L-arabinose transferase-like glycosyltransferase